MDKKRRSAKELEQIITNRTGAFVMVMPRNRGWTAKALFAPIGHRNRHAAAVRGDPQPLVDKAVRDLNDRYELQR